MRVPRSSDTTRKRYTSKPDVRACGHCSELAGASCTLCHEPKNKTLLGRKEGREEGNNNGKTRALDGAI